MLRGQLALEALVSFAAFLAFLLLLLLSFNGLGDGIGRSGAKLSAYHCAFETAELATYYSLDGKGSFFPHSVAGAVGVDGTVHCRRGGFNASSKTLVVMDGKEPI